ncbi:MAG: hypothetical protein RMA76_21740 [Deltaproteobacteria bacterium]
MHRPAPRVDRGVTVDPIPDVRAILARHRDPVERNLHLNAAYQTIAREVQRSLQPAPRPARVGGVGRSTRADATPAAETLPNWFAVGAHASPQVGRGMRAASQTLEALEMLTVQRASREEVFDALELNGARRTIANHVARAIDVVGSDRAATAIGAAVALFCAVDDAAALRGLASDPRLLTQVAYRFWNLVAPAEGRSVLDRIFNAPSAISNALFGWMGGDADSQILDNLATLCRTYRALLGDGNRDIFGDIGASAEAFLRLRARGPLTPEAVLEKLHLPESSAATSRAVFAWARDAAKHGPPPADLGDVAAPHLGNDRVRAAFALYVLAGQTEDDTYRNDLVRFGNNLIAWREQAEAVQRAFTATKPGELDRSAVVAAITPVVQVPVGRDLWTFFDFASRRGDRDGNPLTAPAGEVNWAKFEDRWPAILDSFDFAYARPAETWRFPRDLLP